VKKKKNWGEKKREGGGGGGGGVPAKDVQVEVNLYFKFSAYVTLIITDYFNTNLAL